MTNLLLRRREPDQFGGKPELVAPVARLLDHVVAHDGEAVLEQVGQLASSEADARDLVPMEPLDDHHAPTPQTPAHLLDGLLVASVLASAWATGGVNERHQIPPLGAEVPRRGYGVHGLEGQVSGVGGLSSLAEPFVGNVETGDLPSALG